MDLIFLLFFSILGLIVGSFLNVLICRFNTGQSLKGRSMCMSCQHGLCWYELVPLFSFLALKGRCRVCKTRISKMYPIVESVTAVIFIALFLKFQDLILIDPSIFVYSYLYYSVLFSILIIIAFYDLRHKIIPDSLSFTLGVLSFMGLFFFNGYGFGVHMPSLLEFFSGFLVATPFFLCWLLSKGTWMGLGDAKLMVGLTYLVGLSRVFFGIVLAFWTGALFGVLLLMFSKKYGMKSEVPFAPFLVFGIIVAFLCEFRIFF